jgi:hypothetical protein
MVEDPKGIRQIAQERAVTRRKKDDYFRWLFAGMRDILLDHLASRKPVPPITDHGVVSPLSPAMQQKAWTREELISMETVLLAVTEPRNVPSQVLPPPQLPITGDVMKITQENKQTTAPSSALEALEEMVFKSLIVKCQKKIIDYYYAHDCIMPLTIEMSRSNKLTLNPHLAEGEFFPDTHVRVVGIDNLEEMICKPIIEAPAIETKNTQDPHVA